MGKNIPYDLNGQSIVNFGTSPCFITDTSFFKKIETSSVLTLYYSPEREKLYESLPKEGSSTSHIVNFEISPCFITHKSFFKKIETRSRR